MMATKRPILIVEDDELLRDILVEQFSTGDEFVVSTAGTIEAADRAVEESDTRIDAVILDVGLPDGDGCDFCVKLRRYGRNMPVIMLTGADGETDIVRGLESGANDYVVKPFRATELLARLRAQLRVFDNTEDATFTIGPFTFWPSKRTLQISGEKRRIRLTDKEAAILKYLYRLGGQAVDRQSLLHEIWGYNPAVTTHTLETHIYRIRQKIEADPRNPVLLKTNSSGYFLVPGMVPTGKT